jgi:hypothetical protein
MKLETPGGRYFSLTIERYEFPEEELGPNEDNPAEDFDLRVHVSFEFLPSWANSAHTVTIEFPLTHINLDRVIASPEQQLARFPGRPPIENGT